METHIVTFTINNDFSEWSKNFDDSLELQKKSGINTLYRGVSVEDKSKCVAIMQACSGVLEHFVKNNQKMISESGHAVESTIIETYVTQ